MMSLKNCIFLRDIPGRQKKQFLFFKEILLFNGLLFFKTLRGLPRKILGTCFLDFFGMFINVFGIVCQMKTSLPAA